VSPKDVDYAAMLRRFEMVIRTVLPPSGKFEGVMYGNVEARNNLKFVENPVTAVLEGVDVQ